MEKSSPELTFSKSPGPVGSDDNSISQGTDVVKSVQNGRTTFRLKNGITHGMMRTKRTASSTFRKQMKKSDLSGMVSDRQFPEAA